MTYNLFLVTSPLQLINATEAREHFKTQNNRLVAIFTDYQSKNKDQILNLINDEEWDDVIRYELRTKNTKTTFFRQIELVKTLKKDAYDFVFPGDLSSIIKMLLANINKNKIFLIDDGATTINRHLNELAHKNHTKKTSEKLLRQLRFNIFGIKTTVYDKINMFTSYKLSPHNNEEIIYNDLQYFKDTYLSKTTIDNNIYLLGMQISEINIIQRQTYLAYLESIVKHYNNKKIIYIPHRFEKNLEDIQKLENDLFKITFIDLPIELEFITKNQYPMQICSFFSSALFTLNTLYPKAEIIAFKINKEDMLGSFPNIENVYSYIKKSTSIKTIKL